MTNIYFSPTYTGHVFLQSGKDSVMMDTQVVSLAGLVALLELRLGIHHDDASPQQRIICYHDCMKQYLAQKKDCLFAKSFEISPLSTAKAVLAWRDELRWTGWSSALTGSVASERLQDLAGIEKLFEKKPDAYDMVNHLDTLECMLKKQSIKIVDDLKIFLPYDKSLMRPKIKALLDMIEKYGASIKQTPTATGGNNNLSTVRRLLCASTVEDDAPAGKVTLADLKDDSLLIWHFPDEMTAAKYLSYHKMKDVDVWINTDNKQMDDWLARMGRPLTGSIAKACTPQLTQLFVMGIGLFKNPLNIKTLIGWLTMPIHPLERNFRSQLAAMIARMGGYRNDECRKVVDEYVDGKFVYLNEDERKQDETTQENRRKENCEDRLEKVNIYLPAMEKPNVINRDALLNFSKRMVMWAKARVQFDVQREEDLWKEQLLKVADLYNAFATLLEGYGADTLDEHTLATWVSTLYKQDDYTNAVAQQNCRIVVDSPSKIISLANRTVWMGVDGDEGHMLECTFLSPSERQWLAGHNAIAFWSESYERAFLEHELRNAFLRTSGQLILVSCKRRNGEIASPHPLMVRLEQQIENLKSITIEPSLDKEKTEEIRLRQPMQIPSEIHFNHTELIKTKWPDHLSPTTLEVLIENPLDYVLQYLLRIKAAEEAQLSKLHITKGNVAHSVIAQLFAPRGEADRTTPAEATKRIKEFDKVYEKQVEAKGGQLQLEENLIEARIFKAKLKVCIKNLLEILQKNELSVTACEQKFKGHLEGVELPHNAEQDNNLSGDIDMTLEDGEGNPVVFDFKWTSKEDIYKEKLRKNRSVQLELYRYLLSHTLGKKVKRVAYFLMPEGTLHSREHFEAVHFYQEKPLDDAQNAPGMDVAKQVCKSIIYRKKQIDGGLLEAEGQLADMHYNNDTEAQGLFPLEKEADKQKKETGNKQPNKFSDYTLLNGKQQ